MSHPQVYFWPSATSSVGAIYNNASTGSLANGQYLNLIPPFGTPDPNSSIDKVSGFPRHVLPNMWRQLSFHTTGTSNLVLKVTGKGSVRDDVTLPGPLLISVPRNPIPIPLTVNYTITNGTPVLGTTEWWDSIDNIQIVSGIGTTTSIQIGYGAKGITSYCFMDYNRINYAASGQIQVTLNGTSAYGTAVITPLVTLTRPETPNPYVGKFDPNPNNTATTGNRPSMPFFGVRLSDTATTIVNVNSPTPAIFPIGAYGRLSPVTLTCVTVDANTTENFYFTVLQQGIRT